MNQLLQSIQSASVVKAVKNGSVRFIRDEEGAQIVEYALIIAVVSIALVVAISAITTNGGMSNWIGRVKSCLTSTTCA
jgi:pilus assembly protein Flp/PilA